MDTDRMKNAALNYSFGKVNMSDSIMKHKAIKHSILYMKHTQVEKHHYFVEYRNANS